jgi:methyltransferase-like protein
MEIDDDKEGSFIKTLIEKVNNVSVRVNKKAQESEEKPE